MTAYRKYTVIGVLLLFLAASQSYLLRPFWFDESLTLLNFALQPLEKIYFGYVIPNNHIGFTMLLRIWYLIMPQNVAPDVWCRLLPLAAAAGFLIFSYLKFKNFIFRLGVCCFVFTTPFLIYATSVRGYMLSLALSMTVLYFARRFAAVPDCKNGVKLFVFSLFCVSVLPSNLFVVMACCLCGIGLCGRRFWRTARFYLLFLIPSAAFAIFWLPILGSLLKAANLGEGWHDRTASLAAGAVTFAVCAVIPFLLGVFSLVTNKRLRRKHLILLAFLTVIPLVYMAKVAPFPRVYFPFFGVFIYALSVFARRGAAAIKRRTGTSSGKLKIALVISGIAGVVFFNCLPSSIKILSQINGGIERDDYFAPWYCSSSHVPHESAKLLAENKVSGCYLSFSSDPWSVMYYSALSGLDISKFCFDGPRGRVEFFPAGYFAVINRTEDIKSLSDRFGVRFSQVAENSMHKIYVRSE